MSVLRTKPIRDVLAVSALACLYLMLNLSVETWIRFLAWMLLGGLIYFGYGYRRNRLARREAEVAEEPTPALR